VFPFSEEMTLRDLVMQAGGLRDDAYVLEAEVARLAAQPDVTGDLTEVLTVPLDSSYVFSEAASDGMPGGREAGGAAAPDFDLQRYDNVFIRRRPGWELQRTVTLTGEVKFPGRFALQRKDERLVGVIERAGGLTGDAYAEGVRFYRQREVAAGAPGSLSRVNVSLSAALEDPASRFNVILADGDSIDVPEYIATVRVEGAVLFPVSILHEPGEGLDYYISGAGGYARDGDKGRTRVEYANGSVKTVSKFLFFKSKPKPDPGSRIYVPVKPPGEPINWSAVTATIVSAVTVYAILTR